MSCKQVVCEGVAELFECLEANKTASSIFILFSGKEDPSTGKSWCPDCSKAEPIIEECLPKIKESSVFIFCIVGDRPSWKDPNSEFRKHPKLLLKSIPTLMKWRTPQKLGDVECSDKNLVSMLFEDEE